MILQQNAADSRTGPWTAHISLHRKNTYVFVLTKETTQGRFLSLKGMSIFIYIAFFLDFIPGVAEIQDELSSS